MKYKTNSLCDTCSNGIFTWHKDWWSCDKCGQLDVDLPSPESVPTIWVRFCQCDIRTIMRLGRKGHDETCIDYDKLVESNETDD